MESVSLVVWDVAGGRCCCAFKGRCNSPKVGQRCTCSDSAEPKQMSPLLAGPRFLGAENRMQISSTAALHASRRVSSLSGERMQMGLFSRVWPERAGLPGVEKVPALHPPLRTCSCRTICTCQPLWEQYVAPPPHPALPTTPRGQNIENSFINVITRALIGPVWLPINACMNVSVCPQVCVCMCVFCLWIFAPEATARVKGCLST